MLEELGDFGNRVVVLVNFGTGGKFWVRSAVLVAGGVAVGDVWECRTIGRQLGGGRKWKRWENLEGESAVFCR